MACGCVITSLLILMLCAVATKDGRVLMRGFQSAFTGAKHTTLRLPSLPPPFAATSGKGALSDKPVKVGIVGAGMGGLAAAYTLHESNVERAAKIAKAKAADTVGHLSPCTTTHPHQGEDRSVREGTGGGNGVVVDGRGSG